MVKQNANQARTLRKQRAARRAAPAPAQAPIPHRAAGAAKARSKAKQAQARFLAKQARYAASKKAYLRAQALTMHAPATPHSKKARSTAPRIKTGMLNLALLQYTHLQWAIGAARYTHTPHTIAAYQVAYNSTTQTAWFYAPARSGKQAHHFNVYLGANSFTPHLHNYTFVKWLKLF